LNPGSLPECVGVNLIVMLHVAPDWRKTRGQVARSGEIATCRRVEYKAGLEIVVGNGDRLCRGSADRLGGNTTAAGLNVSSATWFPKRPTT
jgi:hypothetical protein